MVYLGLPVENGSFHGKLLNNQMVSVFLSFYLLIFLSKRHMCILCLSVCLCMNSEHVCVHMQSMAYCVICHVS